MEPRLSTERVQETLLSKQVGIVAGVTSLGMGRVLLGIRILLAFHVHVPLVKKLYFTTMDYLEKNITIK